MDTSVVTEHLVECAKFFRHHRPDREALPDTFRDDHDALECMKDVLLYEAHHAMQEALAVAPEVPVSNAIDLDSAEPGIVRTVKGKTVTQRSDDVVRPITYQVGDRRVHIDDVDESVPPPKMTPARLRQSCVAAERSIARAHARAEQRAAESFLTKEERKALAQERKAERERKQAEKRAKQEQEGAGGGDDDHDAEGAEDNGADGAEDNGADAGDDAGDDAGGEAQRTEEEGEGTTEKEAAAPHDPVETLQRISPMGDDVHEKRPKKQKPNEGEPEFFGSPAPHDRYLQALQGSALHPSIRETVLRGVPSDNAAVVVTHGPPGCGKTHALLEALEAFHEAHPDARCFVCGPTNVSAADLYARAFARGIVGCLALSRENMPPGVPRPRAMDLRTSKFVFSTVAGRCGPRLHNERFHAVFLDEAGLCPEAIVWGLLRPDVRHIWMVGDLKQLGAITSATGTTLLHQRSLMERLVSLGVAANTLTVQRRMHPEICMYPCTAFYDGRLVTQQAEAPAPAGGHQAPSPYAFLHVAGEAQQVGTSAENVQEAHIALGMARELQRIYPKKTVILTPYAAQLRRIRAAQSGIEAYTIDSFQGKEAEAVVLSLVRTPASGLGFWSDQRRLNVALTRAKHALRVVGHGGWAEDGPLGALVADAKRRGLFACA